MNIKYPDITVQLTGLDGNAFAIIGRCLQTIRTADLPESEKQQFLQEAQSSDYDNLLQTCMRWFDCL